MPGSSSTIRMRGDFIAVDHAVDARFASGGQRLLSHRADGGNFDGEARAAGLIVFDANAGVVFGEDVAHDREAQTGAAALGGEVGQEQFLFLVGGDAAAGIGDDDLHGIGQPGAVATQQSLDRRILHGFGGVVDQVDDDALELLGIDHDRRQIRREIDRECRCLPAGRRTRRCRLRPRRSDRSSTGCAAGKRENCENSSTSVFTDAVSSRMVPAHSRSMRSLSGGSVGAVRPGGRCVPRKAQSASADF